MEPEIDRILDALPDLVWSARPDGQVDLVNRGWREFTGLRLNEALGAGWESTIHPDDLTRLLECWRWCLESELWSGSGSNGRPSVPHDGVDVLHWTSPVLRRELVGQMKEAAGKRATDCMRHGVVAVAEVSDASDASTERRHSWMGDLPARPPTSGPAGRVVVRPPATPPKDR